MENPPLARIDSLDDAVSGGDTMTARIWIRPEASLEGRRLEVTPVCRIHNPDHEGSEFELLQRPGDPVELDLEADPADEPREVSVDLEAPTGPCTADYGPLAVEWQLELTARGSSENRSEGPVDTAEFELCPGLGNEYAPTRSIDWFEMETGEQPSPFTGASGDFATGGVWISGLLVVAALYFAAGLGPVGSVLLAWNTGDMTAVFLWGLVLLGVGWVMWLPIRRRRVDASLASTTVAPDPRVVPRDGSVDLVVGATPESDDTTVDAVSMELECWRYYRDVVSGRHARKDIVVSSRSQYDRIVCEPADDPAADATGEQCQFAFEADVSARAPLSFQSDREDPDWGIVWIARAQLEVDGSLEYTTATQIGVRPRVDPSRADKTW